MAAQKVVIAKPSAGGGTAEVSGTVASVNTTANSSVVHPRDAGKPDVTVTTTSTTQFLKSDGSAATFADVVVGAKVGVVGYMSECHEHDRRQKVVIAKTNGGGAAVR